MKRITFIRTGGMMVVTACCGSTVLSGCKAITGNSDTPPVPAGSFTVNGRNVRLELTRIPDLETEGGAVKFESPDRDLKIIVARTGPEEFAVVDDKCTHGGRELEYNHTTGEFRCVSFGHSKYNPEGHVVKGPAKGNLNAYKGYIEGDVDRKSVV